MSETVTFNKILVANIDEKMFVSVHYRIGKYAYDIRDNKYNLDSNWRIATKEEVIDNFFSEGI